LRELAVRRVFGGHDPSFDGDRMRELIDADLASLDGRGAPYAPPDAP